MEKKLNWGLLSTARINRALIRPLKASKRTRLLAVASRNPASAEAYAREWDIPRAHGSYEALLGDPQVDVIYISLPNHMHAEWTIKALRAGKHVLCEKPLALSLQEVDAMIAASQESGRVLAEAFMYRHHPQTLKVKELVEGGALGTVQLIKGAFSFKLEREDDYRNFKDMGGGSIWDVGCYPISYARLITAGEPQEVFGWQSAGRGGGDVLFVGQVKFPQGVLFQFDSSFISPLRSSMEIVGSEACLFIPQPFKPGRTSTIYLRRGDEQEAIKIKGGELYRGEVEDMCDAILRDTAPRVSLENSRGNIATILTLIDSAGRGGPVSTSPGTA